MRAKAFWERVRQGFTILQDRERYIREVFLVQLGGWCFRFAAFWMLLEAFNVGGSVKNVLLVLGVNAVSAAVPFTPQGAGVQQALLTKVFAGTAPAATVAAYSVGQQIAIGALTFGIGFASLVFIFRYRSFREVIARGAGGPRLRPEALASLAHQNDRLGEERLHRAAQLLSLLLGVALEVEAVRPATVMSTASLIALSAQATFCAPCICWANSSMRRRSSSGSPKRPPNGSSEDMSQG